MKVTLSEGDSREVADADALVAIIERHNAESPSPQILTIDAREASLTVGVGPVGCFVQFAGAQGDLPYLVSVGDHRGGGVVTFLLHGVHPTEVSRRHLIPWEMAQRVLREFASAGTRPSAVDWEPI